MLSGEAKEARALDIATDYAKDADLARAQARLNELDVANATQWVVMLAERHIAEGGDDGVVMTEVLATGSVSGNNQYLRRCVMKRKHFSNRM